MHMAAQNRRPARFRGGLARDDPSSLRLRFMRLTHSPTGLPTFMGPEVAVMDEEAIARRARRLYSQRSSMDWKYARRRGQLDGIMAPMLLLLPTPANAWVGKH